MADDASTSKKRKVISGSSDADTVKAAAHPFGTNKGGFSDVVLRSSDGVDFFAHMGTLSLSSPVFGGLFGIPTPGTTVPDRDDTRDGLPVVWLSETSRVLDSILRFVYPLPPPSNLTFREIADVLSVLDKYELTGIAYRVQPLLADLLEVDPVGVYAISAANKIYDLAGKAAIRTLKIPVDSLESPNLRHIPTREYNRLLRFHFDVNKIMQDLVSGTSWFSTLRGLHERSTTIDLCDACYDYDAYSEWYIHRSLRLLILHCKSARFFYHEMDELRSYYEHISLYRSCRTCKRSCMRIEGDKLIELLGSAVKNELEKV
jgi:hypothetical protein